MSTSAGSPAKNKGPGVTSPPTSKNKGKGKGKDVVSPDVSMEDDEDEDDEDEEDYEIEEDEDEEEEELDPEIDPSAIISSGRRTRGKKVDYTSAEALAKAGLKPEGEDDDDEDEEMK